MTVDQVRGWVDCYTDGGIDALWHNVEREDALSRISSDAHAELDEIAEMSEAELLVYFNEPIPGEDPAEPLLPSDRCESRMFLMGDRSLDETTMGFDGWEARWTKYFATQGEVLRLHSVLTIQKA